MRSMKHLQFAIKSIASLRNDLCKRWLTNSVGFEASLFTRKPDLLVSVQHRSASKITKESADEDSAMARGLADVNQNIVGSLRRPKKKERPESWNRNVPVPWEVSVRYMESETYKKNYGDYKVWQLYRRQFGAAQHWVPLSTRITCLGEDGYIKGSSPCPLCRDKFLVPHYMNVKLLEQFISPWTGEVLEPRKTSLCQVKHEELLVAIYLAKDYGTLSFHVPMREFDYSLYYKEEDVERLGLMKQTENESMALQDEDEDNEVMERILNIEEYGYWHKYTMINNP